MPDIAFVGGDALHSFGRLASFSGLPRTATLSIKTSTCSRLLPFAAVVVADKGMPSRSTSQCIKVPFPLSLWFT